MGKTYYYNYDGLGNVVALTDTTGNVVVSYSYDPRGQTVNKTGTLYNPYTYRGYYQDDDAGLYYLINRYYDPQDGRFLSQDVYETLNANLYVYANNDPVNLVDSDGDSAYSIATGKPDLIDYIVGGAVLYFGWMFSSSPDFVVTPKGQAIPIPKGAKGPVEVKIKKGKVTGHGYVGGKGGANGQVGDVRIMNPNARYPKGYVKYGHRNNNRQGVDPKTGKSLPNNKSHFPLK